MSDGNNQGNGTDTTRMLVDVLLPIPSYHAYTYCSEISAIPNNPTGCRVVVPLRKGWTTGFVAKVSRGTPPEGMKDVAEFLDTEPWIDGGLWQLGMWMSRYYFCPPGLVMQAMLPGPVRVRLEKILLPLISAGELHFKNAPQGAEKIHAQITEANGLTQKQLKRSSGDAGTMWDSCIQWLLDNGMARWGVVADERVRGRTVDIAHLIRTAESDESISSSAHGILKILESSGGTAPVSELIRMAGTSRSPILTLVRRGLISLSRERMASRQTMILPDTGSEEPVVHTPQQKEAIRAIVSALHGQRFESFLLHGITGSGKTEIYLAAAEETLKSGKGVICLVPEIALTAQMLAWFKIRFGDAAVVMHSGMSAGERFDAWMRIRTAAAPLVIGPRSAVFAPVRDLGLIVVDEEHDGSYKQSVQPRYHARAVALMRASRISCPVVLGSATPSMESYEHGLQGKYTLLTLKERVDGLALPPVILVDMRSEPRGPDFPLFSAILRSKLDQVIRDGNQAILLLNRRGFSRTLVCSDCGTIQRCPVCDISLTFHKAVRRLSCHYCEYREPARDLCPSCSSHRLMLGGAGTERVEEHLRGLYPEARIARMDSDTTRTRGSHIRILNQMARGDVQILVGTQMISKGLDLPRVALVGVINADTPLHIPDFRAGERAFQLLTQVAGRTGRSRVGGDVVLQSFQLDYPALMASSRHDYIGFAQSELRERREMRYPPYAHLIRLEFSGETEQIVEDRAKEFFVFLRRFKKSRHSRLLGPAPPLMPRIRGRYRRHLLLFHESRSLLHSWLETTLHSFEDESDMRGVRLSIDVDPIDTF